MNAMDTNSPAQPPVANPYYGVPYGVYPTGVSPGDDGVSLLKLLKCILRKWWMVALSGAVGISAAVFYLSVATPLFKAQSLIEMSVRRPRLTDQRALVSSDSDFGGTRSEDIFNTRIEKFKGLHMREMVRDRLRQASIRPALSEGQIESIVEGIDLQMLRRTFLLQISCVSPDPRLAQLGADAYAAASVELTIEENRTTSDNAVVWLIQQAKQQKANLDVLDEKVTSFREIKQIDAMINEREALHSSMKQIGAELTRIGNAQVLAEELMNVLKTAETTPGNVGELPTTTPEREVIVGAVSTWASVIKEREALLGRYTPHHPDVVALANSISLYEAQVADTIRRSLRTAMADAALLRQQAEGIRTRMEETSRLATRLESVIVRAQAERDTIERERNIAELNYNGLLSRIEEARIAADENTTTVKVIESARLPQQPFKPRRFLVLFIGLFLGIGIGGGLAVFLEIIEDRFDDSDEIAHALDCPVLGLVPRFDDAVRSVIGRKVLTDRFGVSAESYARIRARLQSEIGGKSPVCLLVCSAQPSEGKTITAANLALSFARTGVRTLLVDFDMRRPQVKSVFNIGDDAPCLLDVLGKGGGTGEFAQLVVETESENLHVIANHAARNYSASEIIGSKCTRDFMDWVKSSYDLVLIDSPPVGGVSDALTLGGMTDGVVFVHCPGVSRRRAMRYAVKEFTEMGNTVLGVVINGVDFRRSPFFSNYDYHYGSSYYKSHAAPHGE